MPQSTSGKSLNNSDDKVRLDKWLWAARFYKTRSVAKDMIDGGKVHYEGHRVKASKEVTLGAAIRLRQGFDEKTVLVRALNSRRGNATQAATMYEETQESIERRERAAMGRKASGDAAKGTDGRPTKQQRRKILQFRQQQND